MSVRPLHGDLRRLTRDWDAAASPWTDPASNAQAERTYSEEGADWYDYDTGPVRAFCITIAVFCVVYFGGQLLRAVLS